ncbi:MAG: AraC family transcriptional regulator [Pseudomonadota bacterium]
MSKDLSRQFDEFADFASVSNEETSFGPGIVWYSHRDDGPPGAYEAELPAGLHIGCGVARIRTFSKDLGGFLAHGPVANVIYVPEDGIRFSTELLSGAVSSFGYFVPEAAINDDELVTDIVKNVKNKPLVQLSGSTLRAVPRLVRTLGGEFHGKSRETMFQSRAMEMCALASSDLGHELGKIRLGRVRKKIYQLRDYIEANLASDVTLEELAKEIGISTRVMTSAFREMFGESIHRLITRRRLEVAAELLESGVPVASAATSVGYTPNAFSAAFVRHYGYPPSKLLSHKRSMA